MQFIEENSEVKGQVVTGATTVKISDLQGKRIRIKPVRLDNYLYKGKTHQALICLHNESLLSIPCAGEFGKFFIQQTEFNGEEYIIEFTDKKQLASGNEYWLCTIEKL